MEEYTDIKFKEKYNPEWETYLNLFENVEINITEKTNKYCLIIEPRKHEFLSKVIKNFMYILQSKDYGLIIYHGYDNEIYIKDKLKHIKNINYENLNVKNLNISEYCNILTSTDFWYKLKNYYKCDIVLIFQTDTLLFNDKVNDFINYDYVGAPWIYNFKNYFNLDINFNVGNGGLSIRNVDKMIEILLTEKNYYNLPEDIYFCYNCKKLKYNIPTSKQAQLFSIEHIFNINSSGMHKPFIHLFKNQRNDYSNILNKYISYYKNIII